MDKQSSLGHTCSFCGAQDPVTLGYCCVCDHVVCDRCGNAQYSAGERKVTHRECLHKHDDGFKMIKFVK